MGARAREVVRPAPAPVAVVLLVADLEAVDEARAFPAVVAGGGDGGKGAHLGGTWKEIHAVAHLGLAEAGRVLQGDADVHAGRVGSRDILVQAGEVVAAGRGLDAEPVPLQPGPLHARGRNPSLIAPDREAVRAGVCRIGPRRRLEAGESQQAQQESGAEDCEGATDTTDGPSIHGTVVAQRSQKWTS